MFKFLSSNSKNLLSKSNTSAKQLAETSQLAKILRKQFLASARSQGHQVEPAKPEHKQQLHNDSQELIDNPEAQITSGGLDLEDHPYLANKGGLPPTHINPDFEESIYGESIDVIRSKAENKQKNKLKMQNKPKNKPRARYNPKPKPTINKPRPY